MLEKGMSKKLLMCGARAYRRFEIMNKIYCVG